MCDTMVIVDADRVLFAKNSDRDANEGQNIEWHGRRRCDESGNVQCTYIAIPDVEETHAVLISRPFWIWGAEIGANEHGVTIGNEAVFTKESYEKEPGLIGMDLLRLALERAATARDACDVITTLLEEYGQGGGCGHEHRSFTYHNSFIVADPSSAFVLETAGRHWEIEEVKGVRSISNGLTIPEFRDRYGDTVKTKVSGSALRQCRTTELCGTASSVGDLMAVLRDHGPGHSSPHYAFLNGGLHAPCVHAGGYVTSSQSTSSWVAELSQRGELHWVTATSAPCTGIFKPVRVDQPTDIGPSAEDRFNDSLWWRHERFHRALCADPESLAPHFAAERIDIETRWLANPPSSADAFAEADAALTRWLEVVGETPLKDTRPAWTRRFWKQRNQMAGIRIP